MIHKLVPLLFLLLAANMAGAVSINLVEDATFDEFPQLCSIPNSTGCWENTSLNWNSTMGGNDQVGGSGPPAAGCQPTIGVPTARTLAATCLIKQCVNVSGVPIPESYDYGIAYSLNGTSTVLIEANAYATTDCSGASMQRDLQDLGSQGPSGWTTASGTFVSQAGDQSIEISAGFLPLIQASNPRGDKQIVAVEVDDGFLIVDIEPTPTPTSTATPTPTITPTATPTPPGGGVSPVEIPTASTMGLLFVIALLAVAGLALARRRPRRMP